MIKKVTALGCYLCQIFLSFWCWDLCREHVSMQFVPLFHFFISSISLVCLHLGSTLSFGFSFLCFVVLSSVPLTLFHLHLIFFFFFFVILINSLLPCRLSVLFLFYFPFVFFLSHHLLVLGVHSFCLLGNCNCYTRCCCSALLMQSKFAWRSFS